MNPRLTLYDYVAIKNPQGARQLIEQYGVVPAPNFQGVSRQLAMTVKKFGEQALQLIAQIHPDKGLFSNATNTHSNTDGGQAGGCGCNHNFSSAEGQQLKEEIGNQLEKAASNTAPRASTDNLMVCAAIVISLALILRK